MKNFMDENFLLTNEVSEKLYHDIAEKLPILDYHCHISPEEIAENKAFKNITELWLGGDHYKWRLMRCNGVEEKYITGDASDREKFQKWAETLEMGIENPLYHWSHLELRRYFGYEGVLNGETAEEVWNLCNEKLAQESMRARSLVENSGVKLLCTTDDPVDILEYHRQIKEDKSFNVQVLPAFRPDQILNIEKEGFGPYVKKLEEVSGIKADSLENFKKAVASRIDFFEENGCRISDHSLDNVMYRPVPEEEVEDTFRAALSGTAPDEEAAESYKMHMMAFLAGEYRKRNWVMQIHFGVKRNNNTKMFEKLGPDSGFDCMHNYTPGKELADFLDYLDRNDSLPKTVLYSLNPNDDDMIGSIIRCFQNSEAKSKIQQGSAWWFNDNKTGMEKQLTAFANLGSLGNFIGMLTDSRSFVSYPRHEYFRRILCNLIGIWVYNGEYPYDEKALEKIVKGICYNNAVEYFGFDLETC